LGYGVFMFGLRLERSIVSVIPKNRTVLEPLVLGTTKLYYIVVPRPLGVGKFSSLQDQVIRTIQFNFMLCTLQFTSIT
jgi:hypothetical protein